MGSRAHLVWMMHFLHIHHTGEDVGLWPLIRAKNPAAGALLDQMDADHQRIAPAITALEDAARAYRDDEEAREPLLAALAGLTEVLLPHLRREELEMMPVVSATITTAEYHDVEQEHFVKPKSFMELGAEGHWIIDGLGPEDREVILHVVPAVPRFILLRGFARSYRRKSDLLWGDGPAAALPSLNLARLEGIGLMGTLARHGRTETVACAPAEAVWRIVADVTRVGEWSHECRGRVFSGVPERRRPGSASVGATGPVLFRWSRSCVFTVVEPPRALVWRTGGLWGRVDSTQWRIDLEPVAGGTRIVQTYQVLRVAPGLDRVYWRLIKAHRDRRAALADDLDRLAALAVTQTEPVESEPPSPDRHASDGTPAHGLAPEEKR